MYFHQNLICEDLTSKMHVENVQLYRLISIYQTLYCIFNRQINSELTGFYLQLRTLAARYISIYILRIWRACTMIMLIDYFEMQKMYFNMFIKEIDEQYNIQ